METREGGGERKEREKKEGGTSLEVRTVREPLRVLQTALVHSFLSCLQDRTS